MLESYAKLKERGEKDRCLLRYCSMIYVCSIIVQRFLPKLSLSAHPRIGTDEGDSGQRTKGSGRNGGFRSDAMVERARGSEPKNGLVE